MTRIVFMGSPEEVVSPLRVLAESGPAKSLELVAVISQPARPVGRGGKMADPPVAAFAKAAAIHCLQPENSKAAGFLDQLRDLRPDIIVTAAYGQILSQEFLEIPSIATINIHPSQLPNYRGATPVPAVLLDGLDKTAVTILFTVKKLDAGNIILQKDFEIGPDETAGQLTQRLFSASSPMLLDALTALAANPDLKGQAQEDSLATFCKKIGKDMGEVSWDLSATEIVNRYRAFEPWPGSWSMFQNRRVGLTAMKIFSEENLSSAAGDVVFHKVSKSLVVRCAEGSVAITRLKPAGGKEMDATAFWNGVKDKSVAKFATAFCGKLEP